MVYSPPRRAVQDVFICFACDESEGAFAKENHRAEHNLVRCMEKEVVAANDETTASLLDCRGIAGQQVPPEARIFHR